MEHLGFAVSVLKHAGNLAMRHFGRIQQITFKDHESMVTEGDLTSERYIISRIHRSYPTHSILAEETGRQGRSAWQWIIDPLDGTTNYVWQLPFWGIALALVHRGIPMLGAIYLPLMGELYLAEKGKGSTKNGRSIHVSERSDLGKCLALYDSGFHRTKKKLVKSLEKTTKTVYRIRMLGAATVMFALLAQGKADAYIELSTKPWDITAGALLVQEAGGKVTTLSGSSWTPYSKNFVASNGTIHQKLLPLLKEERSC